VGSKMRTGAFISRGLKSVVLDFGEALVGAAR
jgi:hypothetical protein